MLGIGAGLVVLVLDAPKGALAVARRAARSRACDGSSRSRDSPRSSVTASRRCSSGKGGKGVATALGVFTRALAARSRSSRSPCSLVVAGRTRVPALGSLGGVAIATVYALVTERAPRRCRVARARDDGAARLHASRQPRDVCVTSRLNELERLRIDAPLERTERRGSSPGSTSLRRADRSAAAARSDARQAADAGPRARASDHARAPDEHVEIDRARSPARFAAAIAAEQALDLEHGRDDFARRRVGDPRRGRPCSGTPGCAGPIAAVR